jgi:HPt (histidine-containing phosphotransfer) domain-containing protein
VSEEGLDASFLRRLRSLRRGTVEGLMAIFLRTAPVMLEELAAALSAGDAERLVSASHRLHGMSANMGARWLSERCAQLKAAAQLGGVPLDAVEQVAAIAQEYERAAAALKYWFDNEETRKG